MKNILLLLTTLFASITMSATVHKVKASDGADVLKSTIAGAATGDTVLVQEGTFTGNFTMKEGVQVSGGWDANFETKTEYGTILDANADGRVLNQEAAFTTLTVWSNFTIQNGKLTAEPTDKGGAGVWLNKNGQVKHCLIQNNTFAHSGTCMGGGVGNDAVNANTDVLVDSCIIRNNKASHGGGVRIRGTIQNSIIENNNTKDVKAGPAGGAHLQGGRMVNCIVRDNTSGGDTGGVRLYGKCDVINNLIAGNTATGSVGGLGLESALSNIINNTIVANEQLGITGSTAGVKIVKTLTANNTYFVNNVIWGNKSNGVMEAQNVYYISRYDKSKGQRSYNAIIGQTGDDDETGTTSLILTNDNPGFVDAAKGDYRLKETSKLVNFGDKTHNTLPTDLDGKQRVRGGKIDLGAYEYQSPESRNTYVKVGDNLQDSINLTVAGYKVYVQAGTFYGNFTMKDGVDVSGGWDANFETKTEYSTILDAQSNGRVLNQPAAFSTLTVWSNFTIQNGKLTTALSDQGGAGVFLNKKGRVQDCLIQNNIVNTTITGMGSDNAMGGGVSCNSGNTEPDTVAYNCVIKNNTATHGGGVRVNGKGVVVYNCVIKENQTTNNAAGGVHLHNGSKLINCIVRDNKANGDTGGVRLTGGNVSSIINCLIVGNEATATVGGICMEGNLANIINCTIVGNKQDKDGATASLSGVKVNKDKSANGSFFVNNIVWGNITGDTIASQGVYYISRYDKAAGQRSYNAIQGQLGDDDTKTCIQLSAENPGFVEPENGDFRLVLSQLVEGGDSTLATASKDLAGNNRIINDHVDYGCYEYTGAATLLNEKEESAFNEGETKNVVMRRSFEADGSYYTLALPFAMSKEQVAATFGACEISELKSSILKSETDTHMELRLDFAKVASIEANKPYLFLPQADVTNPVFEAVTLSKTANDVETDYADMKAILTPTTFDDLSDGTYFLGSGNMLQPLDETSNTVKAYRGYFVLHQEGEPAKTINKVVRAMVNVNNAPTAITMVAKQAQTKKMLINNQIVIMRNDNVYTVLGSQIH